MCELFSFLPTKQNRRNINSWYKHTLLYANIDRNDFKAILHVICFGSIVQTFFQQNGLTLKITHLLTRSDQNWLKQSR